MLWRIFTTFISTIVGISLFCKGFLFMRRECTLRNEHFPSFKSIYKRLIFVVIDGLRYDFAEKYMTQLLEHSNNSVMFKAIASPPTVTLQRLKSITTGSLPVFIEIGSNFQSTHAVVSDSFISSFANKGNISILGDETWLSLYNDYFRTKVTAPSFDIYDLHGVDNIIKENMRNIIERNESKLVISHFLGVDHCGHVFSYGNEHVVDKIREIDDYLNNEIIPSLSDEDLLVVMSDHGMTDSGSHGGVSREEIESFIYAYSSKGFESKGIIQREIQQIDICPTISVLFGIPIPFLNVGRVIPELIPKMIYNESKKLNADQIKALLKHENISFDEGFDDDKILDVGSKLLDKKWSSFNIPLMIAGFVLILLPLLILPKPTLLTSLHSFSLFSDSFIFGESLVAQFFCGFSNPSILGRIMGMFSRCREDAHRRICLPTLSIPLFSKFKITKIIGDRYIVPTIIFIICLLTGNRTTEHLYFLAYHGFFSTGHQCSLSELNLDAAYAFGNYNMYISPALVFFNEFFPFIITAMASSHPLELISCYSLSLACITCFCIYGRYHLMIWQVFTPRFLFQCFQTLIVQLVLFVKCIHKSSKKAAKTKLKDD